jgi:site-specific recombinase XerD
MIDPQAVEDMLNSCNSVTTRETYSYCIKRFEEWYNQTGRKELNASTLIAYRAKLTQSDLSSSSINTNLSAIKRLAYQQYQNDLMATWTVERFVKSVPNNPLKPKKALTLEQVKAILAVCHDDGTVKGIRDEAILAIMFGAGLRRSEVIKLNLNDFDGMDIYVMQSKGRKSRYIPLPQWAIRRVNAWLEVRPQFEAERALFVSCKTWYNGRMSDSNLYALFTQRTKQVGLRGLHPHTARITYITQLLKLKNDIVTIGRLVGHEHTDTTKGYDLRGDEELRGVVNSFILD